MSRIILRASLALALLTGLALQAQPTMKTLFGGLAGYADGDSTQAKFRSPAGIAIDYSGQYLLVADRSNNVVRVVNLLSSPQAVWTFGIEATNLVSRPIAVTVNGAYDVTVLNRGLGTNGSIYTFNSWGETIFTNALKLTNAAGMAVDRTGNIYVTVQSNVIVKIDAGTTNKSTVATVAIAGANLQGLVVKNNGMLAVCDSGRHGVYLINPTNGVVLTNSGFHGAGDFVNNGNNLANANQAKFRQPMNIVETGDGSLIVSDYGNHRYKVILPSGVVSNLCGVSSNYWNLGAFPPNGQGGRDGTVKIPDSVAPNVEARFPVGMVLGWDGTLYTTEAFWHVIRKVTTANLSVPLPALPVAPDILSVATNYNQVTLVWSTVVGSTNYNVKRSQTSGGPYSIVATTTSTTYTDTNVFNGTTYYYVVSASNAGGEGPNSGEVSARPPLMPVPDPKIGYVDFPADSVPFGYTAVFHAGSSFVFNNDYPIVIVGTAGTQTFYEYGLGTNPVPSPTSSSFSAPVGYQDGMTQGQVAGFALPIQFPDYTIKAVGKKADGSPDSAVVQTRIQFVTANPVISGNNAAQFFITDATAGARLYYTLDGSDPSSTNANAVDLGTVATPTNVWTVSFAVQTNTLFKVAAFRDNYQASGIVSNYFTLAAFQPTAISFGFANGEASSDFVASPGQTFYAPVTLNLVGNPTIYSLQFSLTVTNGVTNSGPPITAGNYGFQSMLEKPIPGITPTVYEYIPPAMFVGLAAIPNPITFDGSSSFSSLLTTNTANNFIGVGWVERAGETNLYDTTKQTLISYSQAHDTQFGSGGGKVIVGGFNVKIPVAAVTNQSYKIQIGRPTATDDGIGAPGSDVYISAPTNAGTGGGTINALKYITVGQRKYIAGSVYPFRWFNAGDFGSSNIVSADVVQVFEAAIVGLNSPQSQAPGSDFEDAMDSCGRFGVLNQNPASINFGYYTNVGTFMTPVQTDLLFNGDDTTINQVAFGDGSLDVCDVYVTFRRSLDPSLTWFRRFWNGGQRVADTNVPNIAPHVSKLVKSTSSTITPKVAVASTPPQVNFTAGDVIGSAGQTVQIPISATILGSYPLRVLMLNMTVVPLDGSPAISAPVSFTQSASVLGSPYTTGSKGYGNYSAVWLNSGNAGLTGTVTLGYLNVTIPAGAGSSGAYAVRFDHASASPNGLASFPDKTLTGVLTTSVRTNSSFNDGIPDTWRMRWFGTVNNALSASNACPTGDGVNNWKKFVAGVDPNVAGSFPSVNKKFTVPTGYTAAIQWPSVQGKKYAIERSPSLYNGTWSILATNTGTGANMEYNDNTTNTVKFYRVRILP